jgi:alkylation response protein AidB-like acyl-CoA dehydrogenase
LRRWWSFTRNCGAPSEAFVAHDPLNRRFSDIPVTYTIFEGTSEIQRLVIARAISGIHIN